MKMRISSILAVAAVTALSASMVVAQETATTANATAKPKYTINQRKVNQQQRIGEGVENGSLTAGEARRLERKERKLNREEKAMKGDGKLNAAERAKLQHQQNVLSKQIYNQKHDAQKENLHPTSEVGKRQRAQQQRIGEGIENGSLTSREAARMEARQVDVNHEVRYMRQANGGVLTAQQRRVVNRQQNRNSRAIYRQKHDRQHR